jgi:hypothetical protein
MRQHKGVLTALTWLAFVILLSAGRCALSATTFAHIELVEGIVTIVDDKGQSRIPHAGDSVEEGDTITTGGDGELQMLTEDHGLIAVRSNTKLKVEAYRANGNAEDTSVISLFSGTFRSITGWIGTFNRNNYQIKTPTAVIAVRGTDHEPLHIPEPGPGEQPVAPPGTYDKVNSGSIAIRNSAGEVVVNPNEVGFAPHEAKSAPHISKSVPQFYRASRNEGKIEGRKAEVEKEIVHRRTERQNKQPPKEHPKGQNKHSEERVQHHANQAQRNLHNQAATSHKVRHERHRVRIPATPLKP